ncbi:MAG: glucoamylase family protein [Culicoidibacterales bacterium]
MGLQESKTILNLEQLGCFKFFWNEANTDAESPGYGLIKDNNNTHEHDAASIASVGFGMNAYVVGVEKGWISFEAGYNRVVGTMKTLWLHAEQVEGFFYHFLDMQTAKRFQSCEASVIDTSILVNGLIVASEYFGGEAKELCDKIYSRVNWPFYYDLEKQWFYMSYKPEEGHLGQWDVYGEQLMQYFLAAGSPTHSLDEKGYYQMKRLKSHYGEYEFVYSWYGSLFTHQFSHAWFPFQNYRDRLGMNWFENSQLATLANRQYCIDQSVNFKTFNENEWGLTASEGPKGYQGRYGAEPSGAVDGDSESYTDGTIAPAAALGSIAFCPEIVQEFAEHIANKYPQLIGEYGFGDAYNCEQEPMWYVPSVIGIDKGVTLTMIANYENNLIWNLYERSPYIKKAIKKLEFSEVNNMRG